MKYYHNGVKYTKPVKYSRRVNSKTIVGVKIYVYEICMIHVFYSSRSHFLSTVSKA